MVNFMPQGFTLEGKELLVPTKCDAGWGTRAALDLLEILQGIKPWIIQLIV
jgi:hypothetical protein